MRKNTRVVVLDDFTILYILLSIKFFNHSAAKLQKKTLYQSCEKSKKSRISKISTSIAILCKIIPQKRNLDEIADTW